MQLNLNAPLPDDPRALLDIYRAAKAVRLQMDKEVDLVKRYESAAQEKLIELLPKSGDGVVSNGYACKVTTTVKPAAKDWDALGRFILANGRLDLLQKRLADKAVADMWQENVEVPGVERFNAVGLSVVKV